MLIRLRPTGSTITVTRRPIACLRDVGTIDCGKDTVIKAMTTSPPMNPISENLSAVIGMPF